MPLRSFPIQKQVLPIIVDVSSLNKPATPKTLPKIQEIKRKMEPSTENEMTPAKKSNKENTPIILGVASLNKLATPKSIPQNQEVNKKKELSPAKNTTKESSPLVLLPKNPTKSIQISGIKHIPTANLESINFSKGKRDGLHFKKLLISKHYASSNRV